MIQNQVTGSADHPPAHPIKVPAFSQPAPGAGRSLPVWWESQSFFSLWPGQAGLRPSKEAAWAELVLIHFGHAGKGRIKAVLDRPPGWSYWKALPAGLLPTSHPDFDRPPLRGGSLDPVKGFLSPGDFIPLFEEMNLSYKVDRYVIQEVTQGLCGRIDKGEKLVPVSINLSRADFQMMDPLTELNQAIHNFRQAGYEVWMDDFGSGYSFLNYLKNFEFDEIKLDMIFMKDFDEASKKILTACVKMAKDLGIHTLAEGVETKQQLDFLQSIGCERIQGFYYSKPLPTGEFAKLVAEKGIEIENWQQSKFY